MTASIIGGCVLLSAVLYAIWSNGTKVPADPANPRETKPYHRCPQCGHKFWERHQDEHFD